MSTLFTAFFKLQGANSVPGMRLPRSSPCRGAQPWQAAASAQVGFSLLPLPAELWGQLHENRHGFWCKSCLFPIHWHQPRSATGSKAGREKERFTKMLVCMLLPCGPPFFALKILKCSCKAVHLSHTCSQRTALSNFSLTIHQSSAQDQSLGSSCLALGTWLAVGQRPPSGGQVPKPREMNGRNMCSATGPVSSKMGCSRVSVTSLEVSSKKGRGQHVALIRRMNVLLVT